jgi:methyl acetate hydrolase
VKRRTVIISLLLFFGAAPTWATAPAANVALQQVLSQAVERNDTPGVVGLVVDRKGVLFEGAAGKLDVARNSPLPVDAIFNIASMTKPVTSVAIMMLLEQGKLSLEDPVSKYLPGFDNLQVITKFNEADGTYETRPAKRPITLCHLLTHTSGIAYRFTSPALARLMKDSKKSEWEFPLQHDPGEKWTYGPSTRVLGLVVEKITGQTLESFDQEYIFRPLGMVDTSYAVPADKLPRLIKTYNHADGMFKEQQSGRPIPTTPTPPFAGDGGLYSTASDYGKFMRMLLNGGRLGNARILSAKSVRLMGENQIGPVLVSQQTIGLPALSKPFPLGAGHDKFGLGFQLTGAGPDTATYRRAGSMSWAGLFNTEFWIDPHTGIAGALLMQYLPFYDDSAIRTLREFEAAVYKDLAPR